MPLVEQLICQTGPAVQVEEGGRYSAVSQPMVVFPTHLSINTDPRAGSVAGSAVPSSPAGSSPMSHQSVEAAAAISAAGSAEGTAEAPDSVASLGARAPSVCGSSERSFSDGSLVSMEEAADYEVGPECKGILCGATLHAVHLPLPCLTRAVESQVAWGARLCSVRCMYVMRHPVMQVVMLGQASQEQLNKFGAAVASIVAACSAPVLSNSMDALHAVPLRMCARWQTSLCAPAMQARPDVGLPSIARGYPAGTPMGDNRGTAVLDGEAARGEALL